MLIAIRTCPVTLGEILDCEIGIFYILFIKNNLLKSPDLKSAKDSHTFTVSLMSTFWLLLVAELVIVVVDIEFEVAVVEDILEVEFGA